DRAPLPVQGMAADDRVVAGVADEPLFAARAGGLVDRGRDNVWQLQALLQGLAVQDQPVEGDPVAAVLRPGLAGVGDLPAGGDELVLEGAQMFTDVRTH